MYDMQILSAMEIIISIAYYLNPLFTYITIPQNSSCAFANRNTTALPIENSEKYH